MGYKKVIEVLEALPQEEQRFVAAEYKEGDSYCVIGRLCPSSVQATDESESTPRIGGLAKRNPEVLRELLMLGLSIYEAQELQEFNDSTPSEDGPSRFRRVLDWLRAKEGLR